MEGTLPKLKYKFIANPLSSFAYGPITDDCTEVREKVINKYCTRIYRSSFGRENDRFHENMPKPLVFNLIRTQKRRSRLVLDEIKLGGGFQILGLRRGRDQLVFIPKERPY